MHRLLLLFLIGLLLSCGQRSDGFGSETTNGSVALTVGIPEAEEMQYEVTLIPSNFNPTTDTDSKLRRDTTDEKGVLAISEVSFETYNVAVKPLIDTYNQRLFVSNVVIDNEDSYELVDTLVPTGSVQVQFSNKSDVEGLTVLFIGTEFSKKITEGIVFNDPYYVITLDSLSAGSYSQLMIWEGVPMVPYVATDSIDVFSDSTVVVNSLL